MIEDAQMVAKMDKVVCGYLTSNRTISSSAMLNASLSMSRARSGWRGDPRPAVANYEQSRIHVFAEINSSVEAICRKVREWEYTHWMGFQFPDVQLLLRLRDEWDNLDWSKDDEDARARQEELRRLFDPPWDSRGGVRLHAWQPYFQRRRSQPLQETLAYKSWSGTTDKVKIMIGGAAGRMLVAVEDRAKPKNSRNHFDNAWVSMIFDETAEWPRGGIQGLSATREEALGLVQEAIDNMPKMVENNRVSIV